MSNGQETCLGSWAREQILQMFSQENKCMCRGAYLQDHVYEDSGSLILQCFTKKFFVWLGEYYILFVSFRIHCMNFNKWDLKYFFKAYMLLLTSMSFSRIEFHTLPPCILIVISHLFVLTWSTCIQHLWRVLSSCISQFNLNYCQRWLELLCNISYTWIFRYHNLLSGKFARYHTSLCGTPAIRLIIRFCNLFKQSKFEVYVIHQTYT